MALLGAAGAAKSYMHKEQIVYKTASLSMFKPEGSQGDC